MVTTSSMTSIIITNHVTCLELLVLINMPFAVIRSVIYPFHPTGFYSLRYKIKRFCSSIATCRPRVIFHGTIFIVLLKMKVMRRWHCLVTILC
ncbi:hypothetical protein Gorai_002137 [Gossypium raimondii]|uniref:Uncharacterized protein n=1 Tax=Gossypium raimondii TaxID=29730 RepID=A0A7J8QK37_GOSRA|nr:hypothetical protein [Gossypium raimondii]